MQIDLSGKVILVTGASRGIGLGISKQLIESGATVAFHFNQNTAAINIAKDLGERAIPFQANLSNTSEVLGLWAKVEAHFGRVDVLINNAGLARLSPIDQKDEAWVADWMMTMQVNLLASSLLCKKAIEHFRPNGGGKIINISSRAAFRGDTAEYMNYAASKGGLVALTRSIARAFGKDEIVAFDIAPGFTRTDMAQEFIDEYGEAIVLNDIALNQLTEPKDIAPLVTLLSSGLGDHLTGTSIDINAGSYVH